MAAAATSDRFEILTGGLAMTRSPNTEMRRFGKRLVADHTKTTTALRRLAKQLGVSLPRGLLLAQNRLVLRLRGLSGIAFGRVFAPAQVRAHRAAIALYEHEKADGSSHLARAFATSALPVLRMHLRMASQLASTSSP